MHGRVTDKIDVYAFGVVLLELLSNRKPINNECPKGQESLVMWATSILKSGKISQLLDPSLGSEYNDCHIKRMVLAATLCIRRVPRLRPQISLILKLLNGDEEVTRWAEQEVCAPETHEGFDEEPVPTNIQSHLNLALLDLEDDAVSISSSEQTVSLEDYLQGRWSRSSSFD
jgi:serine/threonine protein kinase